MDLAAIGGGGLQLRAALARGDDRAGDCGLHLRHDRRARAFLSSGWSGVRRQVLRRRRRAKSDRARAARVGDSAWADGLEFRRRLHGARRGGRRADRRASGGLGRDADRAVRQCGAAARHGAGRWRYSRAPRGGGRPLHGRAERPVAVRRGGAVKAPRFWSKPRPTLLARLLQPTGWAYGRVTARRMREQGARAGAPTICVGNFVAGGAGKTPAALALARMLIGDGRRVAFLSRGYGGAERVEPLLVDANTHTAAMVGDEPLLLAKLAQCWVGADRVRSARSAVEAGANVLVLDDGLQNPGLVKELAFAVVDGETGFGNGLCVPAGPLRAPVLAQLPLVRGLIVLGGDDAAASRIAALAPGKPLVRASLEPDALG